VVVVLVVVVVVVVVAETDRRSGTVFVLSETTAEAQHLVSDRMFRCVRREFGRVCERLAFGEGLQVDVCHQ